MNKNITFKSQGHRLEGRLTTISPTNAAVITHPHPLYGGDMHNPVVEIISKAYQNSGWSTLCFNFRGTGQSEGNFDDGMGEQEDVDSAMVYMTDAGFQKLELAGYSFGAWVLASRAQKKADHLHPMRFIAPPVGFISFKDIQSLDSLKQVVVGTQDEFAPLGQVETMVSIWNSEAEFNVIENTDHFYWHHLTELQRTLETSIHKNENQS